MKLVHHRAIGSRLRPLLVLALAVSASTSLAQQRRGMPPPDEVVIPSGGVDVALHRVARLPVIEATINGDGPYRFIVDTGAAGVVVDQRLFEKLEIPAPPGMPGGGRMMVVSPSGPVEATLGHVESLKIGGASVRGVWTIGTALGLGDDVDGVIGMSVFRSCLFTIDYAGGRFKLSRGALPEPNGRDVLEYTTPRHEGSHPLIDVRVDGEPVEMLIDSGMSGWFGLMSDWADNRAFVAGPVEDTPGIVVGGLVRHEIARIEGEFTLGGFSVRNPVVRLFDRPADANAPADHIVGSLFLEQFVVTFDGANKRLRLADGPNAPATTPGVRTLGVRVVRVGEALEVRAAHPETRDLAKGDVIHSFNGRAAADLYATTEWDQILRSAGTINVVFTPAGSSATREAKIRVLELIPDEQD